MTLKLYQHPLASYCWKVLIALYEAGTPFEAVNVNLGDPIEREAFFALAPTGKMPVLVDESLDAVVGETSIVIEYLDRHHPGHARMIPDDPERAREVRFWDRFFDIYVHDPMQRIIADRLRPDGKGDAFGVEEARNQLLAAYGRLETRMAGRDWAASDRFTMADCAAAPPLFYADLVEPLGETHPQVGAYLARLRARPSVARVIEEAKPWFDYFPGTEAERARLPT